MKLVLVFSIIWVALVFMVLPIGIQVPKKTEKGFADSAPNVHYLGPKLLWTAIVSLVLTVVYWYKVLN
jgi:predicted secreted protein